eukprot:GDKH01017556.1.p1 GENE.GDKH01017556.1~~GDKH01017556.1.p1  ORF type:complete len:70 (-),score=4.89 GDKH01017556.1:37-246(-)
MHPALGGGVYDEVKDEVPINNMHYYLFLSHWVLPVVVHMVATHPIGGGVHDGGGLSTTSRIVHPLRKDP